jgi:DNA-binding MarR family transcriptional regulator
MLLKTHPYFYRGMIAVSSWERQVDRVMIPKILEGALGYNLYRVSLIFRRELMAALSPYGITPEQWQTMAMLWETESPLIQEEIARGTLKDKFTVSKILRRLERDAWVQRRPSANDKRAIEIRATAKGRSMRFAVQKRLEDHFKECLNGFTNTEQVALLASLKRLRSVLGDYHDE